MAILGEETYGTLAAGTAVTSTNTTYDLISGSGAITAITDGVRASAGRYATAATATTAQARLSFTARGEFYARFYVRVPALPSASITFYAARAGTTFRADLRLTSTGTVQLRDQNTAVATSTVTVPVNAWHRAEWHWNQAGNAQELRMWLGSNRDATGAPDITLTGTAGGGTADNTIRGIATSIASMTVDVDDDRIDDSAYIGPSTPPPTGPIGTVWEETYGTLAAGTTLTTSNTTYDLVAVGTGATATALTDGVRSSAGRYAVTSTSTTALARKPLTVAVLDELYWRFYIRLPAAPTALTTVAMIRNGTAVLADIQINTTGQVRLRDNSVLRATSTQSLTPGVWHRLEWHWNKAGGQQELRLWLDANREGTLIQTATLTGTVTTSLASADNTLRGVVTAVTAWNVDIDDDKGSDTDWPGPTTPDAGAPPALLEGFEGGAPAAALTSATTDFDAILPGTTAAMTFDVANPASGAQSGKLVTGATDTAILRHDIGALVSNRWWRAYVTLSALPGVITTLAEAKLSSPSTIRAQIQVNTNGTLRLREATTLRATSSTAVAPGQMFRIEWKLAAGSEQRLRIFVGGNVHGANPDEEITASLAASTYDRIDMGHLVQGVLTSWWDEAATDDADWLGPTPTPAIIPTVVHTGFGMPIWTTPGAPPPSGTGDLNGIYAPIGNKVIWGATPAAMGTQAINTTNLAALEAMTGRRMDGIRIFYGNCTTPLFTPTSNEYVMGNGDANGGRVIVLSIKETPYSVQEVIDGAADSALAARAAEIQAYGKPVIFTMHHEPDGPNGYDMDPSLFAALMKKVLPFMKARASNLRTCIIGTMFSGNMPFFTSCWPDNDAVFDSICDWIGADPYTFRTSGGSPQALSSILSAFFTWTEGGGKASKPIILAEWGCADDPTNGITDAGAGKSAWYDAAGTWMRDNAARGNRVKLALYYHSPGTVPTTPTNSTTGSYTAASPSRAASSTANSLEAWKRISGYPRTVVNLGF